MRNAITLCALAIALAACGSKEKPAEQRPAAASTASVVEETLPAKGADTTIPVAGAPAPGVVATAEAQALVAAIKSVPEDKRRQLGALLECEEAKIPEGVSLAERPAFMQRQLDALNADPSAVAHCRAGSQEATPTE